MEVIVGLRWHPGEEIPTWARLFSSGGQAGCTSTFTLQTLLTSYGLPCPAGAGRAAYLLFSEIWPEKMTFLSQVGGQPPPVHSMCVFL